LAIVKYPIEDILLAQSGKHLRSFEHSSTRTISSANNRVTEEDIQYVQKEAKNKHLLPEELYIHHFFQNFRIDDNLCEQPFDKEGKNLTLNIFPHLVVPINKRFHILVNQTDVR
jgi:cell division ATPase FtsA